MRLRKRHMGEFETEHYAVQDLEVTRWASDTLKTLLAAGGPAATLWRHGRGGIPVGDIHTAIEVLEALSDEAHVDLVSRM